MASKNSKKRRKARRPAPAAEPTGDATPAASPTKKEKPKSRLAAAMDRMEEASEERPPAPWGNFPLGPLSVLAGLVLIVVGAIGSNPVQITLGIGLGAVGGLEVSLREHFGGFRSHTSLMGGMVFVAAVWLSYYAAHIVLWACLLIGAALALPALWWFRRAFEKASGGLSYKLR